MLKQLALLLSLQLMTYAKVYQVSEFQGKIFKFNNIASGIYEVDIGLNSFQGFISAYGDFNGDKSVDIALIDSG